MTETFNTGHSTTFAHCAIDDCIYHAAKGSDHCEKHQPEVLNFADDHGFADRHAGAT